METDAFIKWLDILVPDKAPLTKMSEWELGLLAGQRILIEQIKNKYKVIEEDK